MHHNYVLLLRGEHERCEYNVKVVAGLTSVQALPGNYILPSQLFIPQMLRHIPRTGLSVGIPLTYCIG